MPNSPPPSRAPKWGITVWRSGLQEPDWRHWTLVYTNQEMDAVLKRKSIQNVGRQGGHPQVSRGFDGAHLTQIFKNTLSSGQTQEAIMRFSLPEKGIPELFLLFYLVPLDPHHQAALCLPIEAPHVPEKLEKTSWSPIKGPQHYGLSLAVVEEFEKQMQRVKMMFSQW